jgi:hypothetical protein
VAFYFSVAALLLRRGSSLSKWTSGYTLTMITATLRSGSAFKAD